MARRRMARGFFGGSLAKTQQQGLQVEITVPVVEGLDFDENAFYRKTGNSLATAIRAAIRTGTELHGKALPQPKPGKGVGSPLNRTGGLIRSIRYSGGWVAPSTRRRQDVSRRAYSNFGLMAIHLSGIYWRRYADLTASGRKAIAKGKATFNAATRGLIDPLGTLDERTPKLIDKLAADALQGMLVTLKGHEEPLAQGPQPRRRGRPKKPKK